MNLIRWFSLGTAVVGLAFLATGQAHFGDLLIFGSSALEIISAAISGKNLNEGMR